MIRKQIDRWFKQAGISVDFVHVFDNVENIKRAVEIGSGVALLPAPTVRREVEAGLLHAVHLEGVPWHRPLGIVHRRNRTLTNPARKLVELLRGSPEAVATSASERVMNVPRRARRSSNVPRTQTSAAAVRARAYGPPQKQGLYDPAFEHDSCGVGFVANIKGVRSRQIIDDADRILRHMDPSRRLRLRSQHRRRGRNTDGFAARVSAKPAQADLGVQLPEPGFYGVGNIFLPTDARQRASAKRRSTG